MSDPCRWVSGSAPARAAETPDENGISHFIEHMVFKGTSKRSAEDIARSVDSIGGGLDAFTAKEMVSYNTKVLDEHLPLAFDVLADMVLNPLFRDEDIEKEKGVILEELKMEVDNPEYLLHEIFSSNFYKDHPIGKPILGHQGYGEEVRPRARSIITIAAITRRQEHPDHRRRESASMTAWWISRASTLRICECTARFRPDPPPVPHARLVFRNKTSLEQTHMYMGVPGLSLSARTALRLLRAEYRAGRRNELATCSRTFARSWAWPTRFTPSSACIATPDVWPSMPEHPRKSAAKVIELIVAEFRELKENLVPDEELRRAKDHLKGSFMLGLESTSSRMGNLARQEMYFKRFFTLDEMIQSIEEVTAEQVQQIAQEFFDPKNITLADAGQPGRISSQA